MKLFILLLAFITPHAFNAGAGSPANKQQQNRGDSIPVKPLPDSLDIKIGQMIIFGFYGTAINKNEPVYKAVKEGKVGSILIYGRNIAPQQTASSLKNLIEGFQKAAPVPLFISIDQEGGKVNRLPTSLRFPFMPSAFYLGNKNDSDLTKYYSDNIAYTLSRLGINLNYAPVVDLHNGACPVLGARERCFSSDPATVAWHAGIVIGSHDYFNVHTVLKHFPGHGNSTTDSHFGVTDVTATWQWEEITPYRKLIEENKVEAIMTAHIVNGKLDRSKRPATLSKPIITGLLRDSLRFKGVIFSDDMQMQAISSQYGLTESILLAIDAGVDVLMFSNNIKGVQDYSPANVHRIIKQLVIKGKISPERIDASFQRIMDMKDKWKPVDQ